jgi:DNA-binding PadR family transcriptional regulator
MEAYARTGCSREPRGAPDFIGLVRAMAAGSGRPGHGPGHGSGHHRGGPFGGGFPFAGGLFGPGSEGPFGRGRGRGRKARRGDVRMAALMLLAEEPRNGYQIMQELEERSDGLWRPSPGSVYPALQQLEDEGLVRSQESDGRKLFHLTDAGRKTVQERPADAKAPWEQMSHGMSDEAVELGSLMKEVAMAFVQVMRVGGAQQIGEAKTVLTDTRKALYRILADGEGEEDEAQPPKA